MQFRNHDQGGAITWHSCKCGPAIPGPADLFTGGGGLHSAGRTKTRMGKDAARSVGQEKVASPGRPVTWPIFLPAKETSLVRSYKMYVAGDQFWMRPALICCDCGVPPDESDIFNYALVWKSSLLPPPLAHISFESIFISHARSPYRVTFIVKPLNVTLMPEQS